MHCEQLQYLVASFPTHRDRAAPSELCEDPVPRNHNTYVRRADHLPSVCNRHTASSRIWWRLHSMGAEPHRTVVSGARRYRHNCVCVPLCVYSVIEYTFAIESIRVARGFIRLCYQHLPGAFVWHGMCMPSRRSNSSYRPTCELLHRCMHLRIPLNSSCDMPNTDEPLL